jgi:hypothetical protein
MNFNEDGTFVAIGDRLFYIEDIQTMYIQANHLIINFDYGEKQIVVYFGKDKKAYNEAKEVFDKLCDIFKAYRIELSNNAIPNPNIMETVYKEQIDKRIQDAVEFTKETLNKRHERALNKIKRQLESLKTKIISKKLKEK